MKTHYIYALGDPRTGELRYVGCTADPAQRLKQHCNPSLHKKNRRLQGWIEALWSEDLKPVMLVLQATRFDPAKKNYLGAEQLWINRCLSLGFDLLNGVKITNAHRAKVVDYLGELENGFTKIKPRSS